MVEPASNSHEIDCANGPRLHAAPKLRKNPKFVRSGFDHHRSLPLVVSLGQISPAQSRGQDAYPPFHFVSERSFGLFLTDLCKELPYIVKQEIGLFQSRKVSAPRHLRPLYYVVCQRNPAKRRDSYLLRKIRIRHRS